MSDHAPPSTPPVPGARGSFPTTQWSMVLHAGAGTGTGAQAALENLCRRYWYPLYVFVRRQGRAHHEAEDCTQEFLTRLLAAGGIAGACPERGRFRTFLLAALRNFLTNEWHRAQTGKRGGGKVTVPLDGQEADQRFIQEPADSGLTPEQAFDRAWARGMIEDAVAAMRREYEKSGRGALFAALTPLLWSPDRTQSPARQAARLGMTEQAFTVALHRLRRRTGERLRACVAETVANPADIDAELRHLIVCVATC